MKAEAADTDAPRIPAAAVDFYTQVVREFPWGMSVIHLRNPSRPSTWRQVAVNSRAKRLLGDDFSKHLRLPIPSEGELAEQPVDIAAAMRYVLHHRRARPLGHVTGRSKFQSPEIYAVHALPLEQ